MSQATACLDASIETQDLRRILVFGAVISAATLFVIEDPTNAPLD